MLFRKEHDMEQLLRQLEILILTLDEKKQYQYMEQLSLIKQRLAYPDMKLAVIGNFSCGKSTFLNALLKEPLLTMDIFPTTAIPTYIEWKETKKSVIITVEDKTGNSYLLVDKGRKRFEKTIGKQLPLEYGKEILTFERCSDKKPVVVR